MRADVVSSGPATFAPLTRAPARVRAGGDVSTTTRSLRGGRLGSIDDKENEGRRREPTEEERAAFEEDAPRTRHRGGAAPGDALRDEAHAQERGDVAADGRRRVEHLLGALRVRSEAGHVSLFPRTVIVRSQGSTAARDGVTEREAPQSLNLAEQEASRRPRGTFPEQAHVEHGGEPRGPRRRPSPSRRDTHTLRGDRRHRESGANGLGVDEIDSPAKMA